MRMSVSIACLHGSARETEGMRADQPEHHAGARAQIAYVCFSRGFPEGSELFDLRSGKEVGETHDVNSRSIPSSNIASWSASTTALSGTSVLPAKVRLTADVDFPVRLATRPTIPRATALLCARLRNFLKSFMLNLRCATLRGRVQNKLLVTGSQ